MSVTREFVIEWILTPILAVATAVLLALGGCADTNESGRQGPPAAVDVTTRPDPTVPQGENLERPVGWEVRLDQPDPSASIGSSEDDDIFFVNMTPGWHVTTHRAAIFYHPANTAEGQFTATAGIYFFDPGDRQREGYGLLFGGRDLEGDGQSYVYFLARNTGEFLIKRRSGESTEIIQDWTRSEAVKRAPGETESVLNEFTVEVGPDDVRFHINEQLVATRSADEIESDGVIGLRLNHGVNVHVADLGLVDDDDSGS